RARRGACDRAAVVLAGRAARARGRRLGAHRAVRAVRGSRARCPCDAGRRHRRPRRNDAGEARRTPTFWLLGGVLFLFYFYYLGVNHHLVAFLSDAGFSDASAARQFSAAVAVGIAGKIGMGLVGDRLPARRAALLTFALMAAGSVPPLRGRAGAGPPPGLPR